MMEKWFQLAIAQGLRSLLVLGLDRTPAAEVLPETIRVWTEDLWRGRGWSESDLSRIEQAFWSLRKTSRIWPQMADFMEALPAPPRPQVLAAPPLTPEQEERRRKAAAEGLAKLERLLGGVGRSSR
jgi:hypothetical protein